MNRGEKIIALITQQASTQGAEYLNLSTQIREEVEALEAECMMLRGAAQLPSLWTTLNCPRCGQQAEMFIPPIKKP